MYLLDADTPAFAAAIVHENDSAEQAIYEAHASIERLLKDVGASQYKLYLTGDSNFRYGLFPEYKANRIKTPRPQFLPQVKEAMLREWNGILSEGCEADDLIGIEQTTNYSLGIESVIVSIDKDLKQIPGWIYNPGIKRLGSWVVEPKRFIVSPQEALHFFYYQLLVGDTADGIKGAVGIGKKKAETILLGCTTPQEYYQACNNFFSCEEELLLNARCLYIWQKESDRDTLWLPPVDAS